MQIREVLNKFEEKYPLHISEDWDNSGVVLGNVNNEVKNIMLTLEITPEALDLAVEKNVNLIIAHHPLIFPVVPNILQNDFKGQKIIKAIQNDITIYASHTSSDLVDFNEYVFNRLGFISDGKISQKDEIYGYGDYQNKNIKLSTIVKQLKENLDIENLIVWGDNEEFTKIGLVTGSGMDFVNEAIDLGLDLFITSDIKHHDAMDAIESGITLIDLTHEASEKYFADFAEIVLDELFELDEIEIIKYYNDDKYLRKVL